MSCREYGHDVSHLVFEQNGLGQLVLPDVRRVRGLGAGGSVRMLQDFVLQFVRIEKTFHGPCNRHGIPPFMDAHTKVFRLFLLDRESP